MISHLACIMDGNRRWARARQLLPWLGHKEGMKALQRAADFCIANQIPMLTLYSFSQENFNRPQQELAYLFEILPHEFYETILQDLLAKDIQVRFVGDRSLFPASVLPLCEQIEQKTATGKRLVINLLFCYGGQQEIVTGVQQLVRDVQTGKLTDQQITPALIERYLWTGQLPEPELIIRTGGAQRLSNFLLYKSAYSELYFLDCLWPDIDESHLHQALAFYKQCQRKFGV